MFGVSVDEGRIEFTIKSGRGKKAAQQKGTIEINDQTVCISLEGYGGGVSDDIAVRLTVEDDGLQRVTLFDGNDDDGTTFDLKPVN